MYIKLVREFNIIANIYIYQKSIYFSLKPILKKNDNNVIIWIVFVF